MTAKDLILPKGGLIALLVCSLAIAKGELWIGKEVRDNAKVAKNVPCKVVDAKINSLTSVVLTLDCGGKKATTKDSYAVASHIKKPGAPFYCDILRDETADCDEPVKQK